MVRVSIEVRNGAARFCVAVRAESIRRAVRLVRGRYPAAGLLTALVPGSVLLIVSPTVLSKNVYKAFRTETSEEQVGRLARFLVPVVALVAMAFTLWTSLDLVLLLLLGYAYVAQLFLVLLGFCLRLQH
jgi:SSS family solute:Na+ symporter